MNNHVPSPRSASSDEDSAAFLLSDEQEKPIFSDDIENDAVGASRYLRASGPGLLGSVGGCLRTAAGAAAYLTTLATHWRALVLRTGFFLLPSFVQTRLSRDPRCSRPDRLGPTAYLDGMRGLAALFVFFCHYTYTCFVIAQGWGYGEENYNVLKLPFVRLLYSGPPMVCIFFVVSGYALSLKPMRQVRARALEGLVVTMSSLVFRRAIRLFLPAAASTLMIVLLLRGGFYETTREFANDDIFLRNVQETHPDRFETLSDQLYEWAWDFFDFVHVWDWAPFGGSTALDVHLWTIPVEFRASMMLFLTVMGTARLKTWIRFSVLLGLMAWVYRSDRWEMLLFYSGMALAEMDIIRGAHVSSSPSSCSTTPPPTLSKSSSNSASLVTNASSSSATAHTTTDSTTLTGTMLSWLWTPLTILSLYFLSQPDQFSEATPGWIYLSTWIPEYWTDKYRYFQSLGAVLFVACVGRSPAWQRFFTSPIVQYFGKISYAIYLMHGPVLHTFGYTVERFVWSYTGVEGCWYEFGFGLGSLCIVPGVIWVSDIFWRAVDAPTVRFARWIEAKCVS